MTESDTGEVRYLLSDGLGSVRHVVDEAGVVVAYREYDPYGSPVAGDESGYGFTGEWWESEIGLLHLRARWYDPGAGVFLSRDVVESEPAYQYVRGNVTNRVDPSGFAPECQEDENCKIEIASVPVNGIPFLGHILIIFTNQTGSVSSIDALPENYVNWAERFANGNFTYVGSHFSWWDPNMRPGDPNNDDPGKIIVNGPYEDVSGDILEAIEGAKKWPDGASAIVVENAEACSKWNEIKNAMQIIESEAIAYRVLGPNSNSAAYSTLRYSGLPTLVPMTKLVSQVPWRSHFGWGMYLLQPLPAPPIHGGGFPDDPVIGP